MTITSVTSNVARIFIFLIETEKSAESLRVVAAAQMCFEKGEMTVQENKEDVTTFILGRRGPVSFVAGGSIPLLYTVGKGLQREMMDMSMLSFFPSF